MLPCRVLNRSRGGVAIAALALVTMLTGCDPRTRIDLHYLSRLRPRLAERFSSSQSRCASARRRFRPRRSGSRRHLHADGRVQMPLVVAICRMSSTSP